MINDYDQDSSEKDESLKLGIQAIKGNIFIPSMISAPHLLNGHG